MPLRVSVNDWIGYEPLLVARDLGYLSEDKVRIVEAPSNTASLQMLAAGNIDAAGLTLDEFLRARVDRLDLCIILVFDESSGADVVMARPEIKRVEDLRGRRLAVEDTALGALMFSAMIDSAGGRLRAEEVQKVRLSANAHLHAYLTGEVDAAVTFEPHATHLARVGAHRLIDSSAFPGLIVDVLAVRIEAFDSHDAHLRYLINAYFRALSHVVGREDRVLQLIAQRHQLQTHEVVLALNALQMCDLKANRDWLVGDAPRILQAMRRVSDIMRANGIFDADPLMDATPLLHTPRYVLSP